MHELMVLKTNESGERPLWETLPSGERVGAFRDWVARLPKRTGDAIPAEALRRENLYD